MESGKDFLANQYAGFQLGYSSKTLDLKDDSAVWNGKGGGTIKVYTTKLEI